MNDKGIKKFGIDDVKLSDPIFKEMEYNFINMLASTKEKALISMGITLDNIDQFHRFEIDGYPTQEFFTRGDELMLTVGYNFHDYKFTVFSRPPTDFERFVFESQVTFRKEIRNEKQS